MTPRQPPGSCGRGMAVNLWLVSYSFLARVGRLERAQRVATEGYLVGHLSDVGPQDTDTCVATAVVLLSALVSLPRLFLRFRCRFACHNERQTGAAEHEHRAQAQASRFLARTIQSP